MVRLSSPPHRWLYVALERLGLVVVPVGVVTRIGLGSDGSNEHSILYPGGKKVLNPWIKFGCPLNSVETRSITPGVSILILKVNVC